MNAENASSSTSPCIDIGGIWFPFSDSSNVVGSSMDFPRIEASRSCAGPCTVRFSEFTAPCLILAEWAHESIDITNKSDTVAYITHAVVLAYVSGSCISLASFSGGSALSIASIWSTSSDLTVRCLPEDLLLVYVCEKTHLSAARDP